MRVEPCVRVWQLEPGEGVPEFDRSSSKDVDDKWFAKASLEGPPSRKYGDGDVDSRL